MKPVLSVTKSKIAAALALIMCINATAALADKNVYNYYDRRDDRWDDRDRWDGRDRDHGRGHGRPWDDNWKHARGPGRTNVVIVEPYRPRSNVVVVNRNPGYYNYAPQAAIVRSNCVREYNPLGTVIGGVAGGALGSTIGKHHGKTTAIIAGTLIGGALGSQYSTIDQYCTREVFQSAPVGTPIAWRNNQGYDYTVTPVRDYNTNGRYCREYTANVRVGGRLQESYGTACYQPDGSWEIVK